MSTVDSEYVEIDEGAIAALGRNWGIVMFLGVFSLIVGIIAVAWPGKTILVVAWLLAIWLIVSGVFQIIRGFSRGLSGGMRALLFISGILSLILGLFALGGAFQAAEILAIFIGIAFLFRGFATLFLSAEQKEGRGWNIFSGIVMLIGGFVVLVWPAITLPVLAWVIGIWLIVGGLFEIYAAFKLRSLAKAA